MTAIEDAARRAREGEISPIYFPEGTRSEDGKLLPFKKAGFAALLNSTSELPVLPMVIEGGRHIFNKKRFWVQPGSAVTVRILPPIERAGHTVDEIMQTCEDQLRDTLELLQNPQGTPLPRLSAQA